MFFSGNEGKLCEHLRQAIDINMPCGNRENQVIVFLNVLNQSRNCKAVNVSDFEFNSLHWGKNGAIGVKDLEMFYFFETTIRKEKTQL